MISGRKPNPAVDHPGTHHSAGQACPGPSRPQDAEASRLLSGRISLRPPLSVLEPLAGALHPTRSAPGVGSRAAGRVAERAAPAAVAAAAAAAAAAGSPRVCHGDLPSERV